MQHGFSLSYFNKIIPEYTKLLDNILTQTTGSSDADLPYIGFRLICSPSTLYERQNSFIHSFITQENNNGTPIIFV